MLLFLTCIKKIEQRSRTVLEHLHYQLADVLYLINSILNYSNINLLLNDL
jgi:hypothetical protein